MTSHDATLRAGGADGFLARGPACANSRNGAEQLDRTSGSVRLRTVALPVEHGGWGLALEPLILGLVVAPSLAGLFLALATMGAFLARHPLKIVIADRRRGRRFARTACAERFVLLYGAVALLGFAAALLTARHAFLRPLLLAAPLALVQLFADAAGRSRALAPELAGSAAMAATAAALALAGGWPAAGAFGLWAILAARVVPTILYVRARLRLLHGRETSFTPVIGAHVAAFGLALGLAGKGWVPALAAAALLALLARALHGYAERRRQVTAKRIGLRELGFGAMTVLAVIAGHFTGW